MLNVIAQGMAAQSMIAGVYKQFAASNRDGGCGSLLYVVVVAQEGTEAAVGPAGGDALPSHLNIHTTFINALP